MNSSNEAALLSIGALLLFVGVGSGIYFFSSNNSAGASNTDEPEEIDDTVLNLAEWGGKRGRKTRRNMHGLKLVKKKTKRVGRSHRRSHK